METGFLEIMRYAYCLMIVWCCGAVNLSATEPYTAVVTEDHAAVHSGPGEQYYPVQQLRTGDKVEIYHAQGDWIAIRPPIGSFSWVSAKYVDFDAGNIGNVLAEGLASRIGSEFSDDCDTVQIVLKKGETVLILGRRDTPENTESPVWLKIAPPNGEFRWIRRSALGAAAPIQQTQYQTLQNNAMVIPELPKVTPPAQSIPFPKIASAQSFSAQQKIAQEKSAQENALPPVSVLDPFQRAFQELQQETYLVMTRPTDDGVFAVLIQRAEELHRIALTDQDLEKTYHLLESLQRTRLVRQEMSQRRSAAIVNSHQKETHQLPASAISSGTPIPRQSIVPAYSQTSAMNTSAINNNQPLKAGVNVGGYDIVGRLGEFDPLPKGHPPYAVVDDKEQIICLISPSANLNLSSYVGQFVGINGILSYYEKPGKPRSRHLSAQNIKSIR